ncbi:hypothetical protein NEUTE1DRAFT_77131 [Neurospora tetrasperma FGSC 2508]|uniref:Uncharacterized protein n=1 Tax=Neurospora tetrasperma (strain FGSC 2508 / ATCC MYA-4615 / P0657) TaxID=510951 RepID=F8MCA1_NEUT8|nr:uncharacterized protein NEUTE1DRAFT_77131 [Neurospora tetrasperma FGSC 2508]EGO61256.1 hypothetical protein NEUTE1DRAFT_77131 [Neurospora tetrasperma FGSC 2508]
MPHHRGTRRHITYACGSRGVIVFSRSHRRESAFTAHLLQCEFHPASFLSFLLFFFFFFVFLSYMYNSRAHPLVSNWRQSHRLVTLGLASLCDRRRCLVGWQLAWLAVMIVMDTSLEGDLSNSGRLRLWRGGGGGPHMLTSFCSCLDLPFSGPFHRLFFPFI